MWKVAVLDGASIPVLLLPRSGASEIFRASVPYL